LGQDMRAFQKLPTTPKYHRIMQQKIVKGLIYYRLNYNAEVMSEGACRGSNTEMFYPEIVQYTRVETKFYDKLCKDCPIKQACLEWGLVHERQGVWGGTTPDARVGIRKMLGWAVTDPHTFSDLAWRS
jgi:hypothetical protein